MGAFLRKYGTATTAGTHIRVPIIKRDSADFATGSNWTPVAGDVKVSINGGTQANITTLPTYSNGAWQFQFAQAELQGKTIEVAVVDSATKAIEDQFFIIETYGHASAMYRTDFSALLPTAGSGSVSWTINVKVGGVAVDGAEVRITSDAAGETAVAGPLYTDASGNADFLLDPGTYYAWIQSAGYDFSNPTTVTVTA